MTTNIKFLNRPNLSALYDIVNKHSELLETLSTGLSTVSLNVSKIENDMQTRFNPRVSTYIHVKDSDHEIRDEDVLVLTMAPTTKRLINLPKLTPETVGRRLTVKYIGETSNNCYSIVSQDCGIEGNVENTYEINTNKEAMELVALENTWILVTQLLSN